MDTLADSWFLWLILAGVVVGLMLFYRQSRRFETGFITSADEFSIRTVLFGLRKGEGDLFMGLILTTIFFSLFLAGFIRWITTLI